jgi:hypothetical protein
MFSDALAHHQGQVKVFVMGSGRRHLVSFTHELGGYWHGASSLSARLMM